MAHVVEELLPIGIGQSSAQRRDDRWSDVILPQPSQGLDHGPTDAPCGRHLLRRRVLEDDLPATHAHRARAPVGEIDGPDGYLIGETEEVGSVGAGGLQPRGIAIAQGVRDVVGARRKRPDRWIETRGVVEAPRELPDRAGTDGATQREVNGVPRSEVEEVGGREHGPTSLVEHPSRDLRIDGGGVFGHPS